MVNADALRLSLFRWRCRFSILENDVESVVVEVKRERDLVYQRE